MYQFIKHNMLNINMIFF